jgi:uncharacterized ion transporter superfamily protein YfcC
MIPLQLAVHIAVPRVSGQAVLTLPVLVPLSDLLGLTRQATVLAYQSGAGLMDAITPTNGALMAILLAAGVPWGNVDVGHSAWRRLDAGGRRCRGCGS